MGGVSKKKQQKQKTWLTISEKQCAIHDSHPSLLDSFAIKQAHI